MIYPVPCHPTPPRGLRLIGEEGGERKEQPLIPSPRSLLEQTALPRHRQKAVCSAVSSGAGVAMAEQQTGVSLSQNKQV